MSDSDGIYSHTQVPIVRVGACGHVPSCQAFNAAVSQNPAIAALPDTEKALGRDCRGSGMF
jgi:hypothetical protein